MWSKGVGSNPTVNKNFSFCNFHFLFVPRNKTTFTPGCRLCIYALSATHVLISACERGKDIVLQVLKCLSYYLTKRVFAVSSQLLFILYHINCSIRKQNEICKICPRDIIYQQRHSSNNLCKTLILGRTVHEYNVLQNCH